MAALLMVAVSILLAILIALVILYGIVNQVPTIQQNLSSAWDSIQKQLSSGLSQDQMDQIKSGVQSAAKKAASGAAGTVGTLISDVGSLVFGIFISINIRRVGADPGPRDRRLGLPPRGSRAATRCLPDLRQQRALLPRLHLRAAPSSACSTA